MMHLIIFLKYIEIDVSMTAVPAPLTLLCENNFSCEQNTLTTHSPYTKNLAALGKFRLGAPPRKPTTRNYIGKFQCCTKHIRRFFCALTVVFALLIAAVIVICKDTSDIEAPSDEQLRFIHKSEWGGRPSIGLVNFSRPVQMVIIKHTRGKFCMTPEECAVQTRNLQSAHLGKGAKDIWYNFLIGGDGNIYVGRGWGVHNHCRNYTIDIAIHGNFDYDYYYSRMENATKMVIAKGLKHNKISEDYIVVCHNQTFFPTRSPGRNVYNKVKKWPDYDNGTYFNNTYGGVKYK